MNAYFFFSKGEDERKKKKTNNNCFSITYPQPIGRDKSREMEKHKTKIMARHSSNRRHRKCTAKDAKCRGRRMSLLKAKQVV